MFERVVLLLGQVLVKDANKLWANQGIRLKVLTRHCRDDSKVTKKKIIKLTNIDD